MVLSGTPVITGEGSAEVVTAGEATELGRLGRLVNTDKEPATPLQRSLTVGFRVDAMRELSSPESNPAPPR